MTHESGSLDIVSRVRHLELELAEQRAFVLRLRRWVRRGVVAGASLASGLVLTTAGVSYSQSSACPALLPAPLVTFCAHTPARASDVNNNFTWVLNKLGAAPTGVSTDALEARSSLTVRGPEALYGELSNPDSDSDLAVNDGLSVSGGISDPNSDLTINDGLSVSGSISDPDSELAINDDLSVSNNMSVGGGLSVSGGIAAGSLSSNSNIYANNDLVVRGNVWQSQSAANVTNRHQLEPSGGSWGRYRNACENVASYTCPDGQYVCGIDFWHGCNWDWYNEDIQVRCCAL